MSSPGEMVQTKVNHIWIQTNWLFDACAYLRLLLIQPAECLSLLSSTICNVLYVNLLEELR